MHKPQSKERGQAWKLIVENLNKMANPTFRVAVRAVRDRFLKLMDKFKKMEKEEERASGIQGADFDELYRGLSDINDRMEDAKLVWEEARDREKENNEKAKALDMRKKATESLSETKRRKQEEGDETPKRKRKSSDAFAMIQEGMKTKREQAEIEARLREEELQERQQARQGQQDMFQQQQALMANMQMQQQQFMMQMQQQNTQIMGQLLEVLKTIKDK